MGCINIPQRKVRKGTHFFESRPPDAGIAKRVKFLKILWKIEVNFVKVEPEKKILTFVCEQCSEKNSFEINNPVINIFRENLGGPKHRECQVLCSSPPPKDIWVGTALKAVNPLHRQGEGRNASKKLVTPSHACMSSWNGATLYPGSFLLGSKDAGHVIC